MNANEIGKWAALVGMLAMLANVTVQFGRIMERQESLARDVQRLEQALILVHPDTARALGFAKE